MLRLAYPRQFGLGNEDEMKTIKELREAISCLSASSAWERGVHQYALEMIDDMPEDREFHGSPADMKDLLNGAQSWQEYSEGGCALIYDADIAERLCTPSELRKTRGGERNPNGRESWIDAQARALYQAALIIQRVAKTPKPDYIIA